MIAVVKTQQLPRRMTNKLKNKPKTEEKKQEIEYNRVQLDYKNNPAQRVTSFFLKFFLKSKYLMHKMLYVKYLMIDEE